MFGQEMACVPRFSLAPKTPFPLPFKRLPRRLGRRVLRGIWFLKFDATAVGRPCTTNVGLCTEAPPPSLSKNRRRGEGGLFTGYTNFHSLSKASGTGKRPIQDAHSETVYPVRRHTPSQKECPSPGVRHPGGVLQEFLGGDVPLGPWNPQPIPELVQLNFAILYQSKLPKSPYPRVTVSLVQIKSSTN